MHGWDHEALEQRLAAIEARDPATPPKRRAAVAVILEVIEAPRVLLMRRAVHAGDPWSGQVSLPGGGHEPFDPDLVATAVRETREEVGVDLERDGAFAGRLAPRQARARGKPVDMDVSPFVFTLERPVTTALNEEAQEAFWLPLDRVVSGELDHAYRYQKGDGTALDLPAWRFEERVVWGMTHRILSELIEATKLTGR